SPSRHPVSPGQPRGSDAPDAGGRYGRPSLGRSGCLGGHRSSPSRVESNCLDSFRPRYSLACRKNLCLDCPQSRPLESRGLRRRHLRGPHPTKTSVNKTISSPRYDLRDGFLDSPVSPLVCCSRPARPACSSLDFSACPRLDLFFCVLFARLPDSRTNLAQWSTARGLLS